MPELGKITATVDVLPMADGSVKVRGVVWSGPDYRTPTISHGAIFEEPEQGRYAADRFIEACERVGIPIEDLPGGHEPYEPDLPAKRETEYDRL